MDIEHAPKYYCDECGAEIISTVPLGSCPHCSDGYCNYKEWDHATAPKKGT